MARTKINITGVMNSTSKGNATRNVVAGAAGGIASTTYAIDSKILNRNNIRNRLTNVRNQVAAIEDDIAELTVSIINGAYRYQNTEIQVVNWARTVGGVGYKTNPSSNQSAYAALFAGSAVVSEIAQLGETEIPQHVWKWFGLEYKNDIYETYFLKHEYGESQQYLFGEEMEALSLTSYFLKCQTGNTEQYFFKEEEKVEAELKGGIDLTKNEKLEDNIKERKKYINEYLEKENLSKKYLEKEWWEDEEGNKIKKEDAPKFYEKKATIMEGNIGSQVSKSLYENTISTGGEGSEVKITVGNAEAHASVSGGFYVIGDDGSKKFSPGVTAEVGTSVTALEIEWDQQWFGDENLGLNSNVTATVGKAEAAAEGIVQVFDESGELDLQLGASASAELIGGEIEGSLGVNVLGGEVGVSGGINYGIGAHAEVGYQDGVFKFDVGASLGVGLSFDVEVDIGGMIDTVADNAEGIWDGVKSGWNSFVQWVD